MNPHDSELDEITTILTNLVLTVNKAINDTSDDYDMRDKAYEYAEDKIEAHYSNKFQRAILSVKREELKDVAQIWNDNGISPPIQVTERISELDKQIKDIERLNK